jgi:hypothetical protein
MPVISILVTLGATAATALLTWALYRMNLSAVGEDRERN